MSIFDLNECPICMDCIDGDKNQVTTECGHKFHASCLMKNVSHNGFGCPYCRTSMAEDVADDGSDTEYSDDDDDDDDDDDENELDPDDFALRGMRWLFQRSEGEMIEDDIPTPSVAFIMQQLHEKGFTMENMIEMVLTNYMAYNEDFQRFDDIETRINTSITEIIENFTPDQAYNQALNQAELERKARRLEENRSIEEEYFRMEALEKIKLSQIYNDVEEEREFNATMKKFSTKPKSESINILIL